MQADDKFAGYEPKTAFFFPGQGAQTVGMAKVLLLISSSPLPPHPLSFLVSGNVTCLTGAVPNRPAEGRSAREQCLWCRSCARRAQKQRRSLARQQTSSAMTSSPSARTVRALCLCICLLFVCASIIVMSSPSARTVRARAFLSSDFVCASL